MHRTRTTRQRLIVLLLGIGSLYPLESAFPAQGVTTATVRGVVRASDGSSVDGASVLVTNEATGFVVRADVRGGRFLAEGLETGGPYTIRVERLGFLRQRIENLYLKLGEPRRVELVLVPDLA